MHFLSSWDMPPKGKKVLSWKTVKEEGGAGGGRKRLEPEKETPKGKRQRKMRIFVKRPNLRPLPTIVWASDSVDNVQRALIAMDSDCLPASNPVFFHKGNPLSKHVSLEDQGAARQFTRPASRR